MAFKSIIGVMALLHCAPAGFSQLHPDSLDAFVESNLRNYNVPGAVVCIVSGDSVHYLKGFGMADVENKVPVDPARTMFRVASLSKLFTTAAVLRQVEMGAIGLHEELTPYLEGIGKEKRFDTSLTLHHLLTHTSGFDNSDIGDATWHAEDIMSCSEFLKSRPLFQAYPSGLVWRYSNYNMVLAGHILETITGEDFPSLMENDVLNILVMKNSTFDQTLVGDPDSRLAKAYRLVGGQNEILVQDYSQVVPAGGLSTTGEDVSHFMLALLGDGKFEGRQLLTDSSIAEMMRKQWHYPGQTQGHALGFREHYYGGTRGERGSQRSLYHTGARPGFSSELVLHPGEKLGVFIVANQRSRGFTYAITNHILSQYGGQPISFKSAPGNKMQDISGTFRSVSFPRGTLEKFGGLIVKRFYKEVRPMANGNLLVNGEEHISLGDGRFADIESSGIISIFEVDGRTFLASGLNGFEKIPWYLTRSFQMKVFFSFIGIFLSVVILWLIRGRSLTQASAIPSLRWGLATSIIGLLTIMGLLIATEIPEEGTLFDHGIPFGITIIISLPVVVAMMAPVLLFFVLRDLSLSTPIWFKIHQIFLLVATGLYLWWTYYWNLTLVG